MAGLEVMISDLDFPEVREVDLKLIELARALSGKIVTNDFNLNIPRYIDISEAEVIERIACG